MSNFVQNTIGDPRRGLPGMIADGISAEIRTGYNRNDLLAADPLGNPDRVMRAGTTIAMSVEPAQNGRINVKYGETAVEGAAELSQDWGIVLWDKTRPTKCDGTEGYAVNETLPLVFKGDIWVIVTGPVSVGQVALVNTDATNASFGTITAADAGTASGAQNALFPRTRFLTEDYTYDSVAIAMLRIR